jgi:hypothetical protein
MKKLINEWEFRRNQESRQRRSLKLRRAKTPAKSRHLPSVLSKVDIKLPIQLSFVEYPEALLQFFAFVHEQASRYDLIFFDFSEVVSITSDAIALFVANLNMLQRNGVRFQGNAPSNELLKNKLYDSGFYNYVAARNPQPITANAMSIHNLATNLDLPAIDQTMEWAITKCYGEARLTDESITNAVGSALAETMYNTADHADTKKRKIQPWALNAHYDSSTGIVCVSFVDLGVGIIKSLKPILEHSIRLRIYRSMSPASILEMAFSEKISSRTRDAQRGLGLPSLKMHLDAGILHRLIAISNGAYVEVGQRKRSIAPAFKGTFIYWEIWPDNAAGNDT